MLPKLVQGRETGVHFPTTIEAFREVGADFLTRAFHAAGSLPLDDRVTAITRADEFVGGGMGRKLHLDVEFARGEGLHRNLFVKFPHDFGHPQRAAFTPPMEAEVRFYLLSIRTKLPINIPAGYFADFDPVSPSGIVITERVAFGQNGIEPCPEKCQDFNLSDQLEYYRTITHAIASLAGAHKSGRLGADVADQFPLRASLLPGGQESFPLPAQVLEEKLAKIRAYAARAPHLLPKNFASEEFLDRFCREARLALEHSGEIYRQLNGAKNLIALCHWNINPDNAWFFRDASDKLGVGLLDWGNVSQLNLARAFWGMVCAAELDFLDNHRRDLMADLVRWYAEAGGPKIPLAEFEYMYRLAISVDALLWMSDAPTIIEAHLPNFQEMTGRHDPRLQNTFLARAQQHILTVMLNEFSQSDVSGLVPMLRERSAQVVA